MQPARTMQPESLATASQAAVLQAVEAAVSAPPQSTPRR
jgi:hypothetical protein